MAAARGERGVLIVSLGSTTGLREADEELAASLRRAGASVQLAVARRPREVRTLALTDLLWARAARAAALAALRENPRAAVVYSSTTAAMFWPRAGAIRFDAPAAGNRPGRHGVWQRPLERRRLEQAPLLLPLSTGALEEAGPRHGRRRRARWCCPSPVEPSGPPAPTRDIAAITYAGNPRKKGLDRVLAAWRAVRGAGRGRARRRRRLARRAARPPVSTWRPSRASATQGVLAREEYRALLRRARVFVTAPRREDYGQAQLEALADGCLLATTPAPGPYAALPIARRLDARLVDEDLAGGASRRRSRTPIPPATRRAREMSSSRSARR